MKGHLEIFEHRLKNMVAKLPHIEHIDLDQAFWTTKQPWARPSPIMTSNPV